MKIKIDADLCSGQGRCYTVSPDLFTSDDEGFVAERGQELDIAEGQEKSARLAVMSCPEGAIEVIEE